LKLNWFRKLNAQQNKTYYLKSLPFHLKKRNTKVGTRRDVSGRYYLTEKYWEILFLDISEQRIYYSQRDGKITATGTLQGNVVKIPCNKTKAEDTAKAYRILSKNRVSLP
jgi:hypothetical protein